LNKADTLIQNFISGSQTAFEKLYYTYSSSVYQIAYYILKDETLAEEIVQDSFLQLWNMKHKLDLTSNLRTLLYVIGRNKSLNRLKQIKKEQRVFNRFNFESEYHHYKEDDLQQVNELNEIVENIIKKLPERQQIIFRLCRLKGVSHKEIASELNITIQTVKNQMVKAQKTIKEELTKTENDHSIFFILFLLFF